MSPVSCPFGCGMRVDIRGLRGDEVVGKDSAVLFTLFYVSISSKISFVLSL